MSVILKAETNQPVRPFVLPASPTGEVEPLRADPREEELARLTAEVAGLGKELDSLRKQGEVTAVEAREEGRTLGLKEAASEEERRSSAVEKGMVDALAAWTARLGEIEGLAALLSRTALAKLFDDDIAQSDLVLSSIARQMRHLRREAVVALRVSAEDFADEAKLAAAAIAIGDSAQVIVCPELGSGECLIDLQLGHVDISPRSQWRGLQALLGEIARVGEPA